MECLAPLLLTFVAFLQQPAPDGNSETAPIAEEFEQRVQQLIKDAEQRALQPGAAYGPWVDWEAHRLPAEALARDHGVAAIKWLRREAERPPARRFDRHRFVRRRLAYVTLAQLVAAPEAKDALVSSIARQPVDRDALVAATFLPLTEGNRVVADAARLALDKNTECDRQLLYLVGVLGEADSLEILQAALERAQPDAPSSEVRRGVLSFFGTYFDEKPLPELLRIVMERTKRRQKLPHRAQLEWKYQELDFFRAMAEGPFESIIGDAHSIHAVPQRYVGRGARFSSEFLLDRCALEAPIDDVGAPARGYLMAMNVLALSDADAAVEQLKTLIDQPNMFRQTLQCLSGTWSASLLFPLGKLALDPRLTPDLLAELESARRWIEGRLSPGRAGRRP